MGACISKLCACCHTGSKYGGDHEVDMNGVGGPSPFDARVSVARQARLGVVVPTPDACSRTRHPPRTSALAARSLTC